MWEGLAEQIATVDGLASVILGEPTATHDLPCVYGALNRFTRSQSGQITAMLYEFAIRLVIRWQDRQEAEAELLSLINAIPAAIDLDPTLGARIPMGLAKITAGDSGFVSIGGVLYRICDFTASVLEKGPVQGGL
jgi:hypothetical protein